MFKQTAKGHKNFRKISHNKKLVKLNKEGEKGTSGERVSMEKTDETVQKYFCNHSFKTKDIAGINQRQGAI